MIDWILAKSPANLKEFTAALLKEKIQTVLRENKDGLVYGITFIDYRTKAVFNGSSIGKPYSIAGIQQKLKESGDIVKPEKQNEKIRDQPEQPRIIHPQGSKMQVENTKRKDDLLKDLLDNEKTFNRIPAGLLKKKRKKKNKNV